MSNPIQCEGTQGQPLNIYIYRSKQYLGRGEVPIIFRGLNQVVDFGVDQFKNTFFCRLLVAAERFRSFQNDIATQRPSRSCINKQLLQLPASNLKMFKVYQDLNNLTQIL